jgi:hypothetical protein
MGAIVAIPALWALVESLKSGPERAFLAVYLPVLLLLPDYYRWVLPGLPDPTFNQAAILPVAALALVRYGGRWRWSATDFLVGAFALAIAYSEFLNIGYADAQNLMFDMAASVVLPYACGKLLIEPFGLRAAFAKRTVWLLFGLSAIGVYEFRFGRTPFRLLFDPFFRGQGLGWVTTFRWGLARVAGPYGHAILAGAILVIGYRLQRWLEWTGNWPRGKGRLITLGLVAGILMTLVRGPWIGGVVGAVLTGIGLMRNRKAAAGAVLAAVLLVGVPAAAALYSWASVGRKNAKSVAQETAAYRKELIDKYVGIAMEKAAFGYGRNTWPRVPGMPSIDNYYLLLALMHGLVALGLLVAILLWMMARLFRHGMSVPVDALPRGGSFAFTMLGIFGSIAVTIATVYMGTTLVPLFALLTGWAEGFLVAGGDARRETFALPLATAARFRFARVVQ